MKKHDWTYKIVEQDFYWIVCSDCGRSDKIFKTKDEAVLRIRELNKELTKFSPSMQRIFTRRRGFK